MIAEEMDQVRPAAEFAGNLAALLARIYVDDEILAQALESGDYSQVPEMTQRYGSILIEVLQVYKEVNDNLLNVVVNFDTYDWGYLGGRLGGEVATTVVPFVVTLPAGGVGVAPKILTLVNAIKKIKNLAVVQKIIPLLTRLTLIATRYDEIALAIRLYRAEACEDLWRVFERIVRSNPALEHPEAIKRAIRELAQVGTKLTQEQRRDAAFALSRRLMDKPNGSTGRRFLVYNEYNGLLGDQVDSLGRVRRGMRFDINHASPTDSLQKYIFPNDPVRSSETWIHANAPCHPLDIVRHRVSRGGVNEAFGDKLKGNRRDFINEHGGMHPNAAEERQLIRETWNQMHVDYSDIDKFDYAAWGQIVDDWLVSQGCP